MSAAARLRTARVLYVAVVLLATLTDLRAEWSWAYAASHLGRMFDPGMGWRDAVDGLRTVALFAGLGAVWVVTAASFRSGGDIVRATALGFALSLLVETAQLFSPDRIASMMDVGTNTFGAAFGAWIVVAAIGAVRARKVAQSYLGVPAFTLAMPAVVATMAEAATGGDAGDVLGARAAVAFVMAAVHDGREAGALAHVERAYALGRIELVTAHAVEVHAERLDVHGDFAERLHAIHVEGGAGLVGDPGDFGDGLERAEFVIGVHDADQHGLGAQGAADVFGTYDAVRGDAQAGDLAAFGARLFSGREHGRVLDGAGDDVLGRGGRGAGEAEDGEIVGLGAAAGEDDLGGTGIDERGHLAARGFQALLGGLSEMVDAGRVTIHLSEARHHRLEDLRIDRCGGVVIEVEVLHWNPF